MTEQQAQNTELNVKTLRKALLMVSDWEMLGVRLGINAAKIEEIANSHDPTHTLLCKRDLLEYWIRSDLDVTWERVATALDEMGMKNDARELRTTYCTSGMTFLPSL